MTSQTINSHDLRAMAAACGTVVVALLPLLVLLPEARPASAFAMLMPALLAVLFLLTGLRLGLNLANSTGHQSPLLFSLISPLLGASALILPEVPGLYLLAMVFLVEAHADSLAVERGHVSRAYGLRMNFVAGTAVIILLVALVATLT
ncbi:MAG: hypothetical protein FJX63_00470 [Alphaproteobacteria bacterium]|nr:hypothetical protein [Alphaproteobacteria bacterium]